VTPLVLPYTSLTEVSLTSIQKYGRLGQGCKAGAGTPPSQPPDPESPGAAWKHKTFALAEFEQSSSHD
jgi:hypothetical protein